MARTPEGAALTAQHRQGQLRIRAGAIQDFIRLWPLWQGDGGSFVRLVDASVPLVRVHRGLSASLAATYFAAFRKAERVKGEAVAQRAAPVEAERLRGTLALVGSEMARKAVMGGKDPQRAMQEALTRTTGTLTRFVLDGGRETTLLSVNADRQAEGYARVTAGSPCAFCAMIASRGPVFGERSANFQAHDHCACGAEPHYEGSDWPGRGREFKALYNRAQREGDASGTANDALTNFRRLIEAG